MILNDEQKARLLKRLTEVSKKPLPCEVCGATAEWTILDRVMELREFHLGGLTIGGVVVPVIISTCANCGHMHLFNAVQVRALEPFEAGQPQPEGKPQ